jgi:hypothetical protein
VNCKSPAIYLNLGRNFVLSLFFDLLFENLNCFTQALNSIFQVRTPETQTFSPCLHDLGELDFQAVELPGRNSKLEDRFTLDVLNRSSKHVDLFKGPVSYIGHQGGVLFEHGVGALVLNQCANGSHLLSSQSLQGFLRLIAGRTPTIKSRAKRG